MVGKVSKKYTVADVYKEAAEMLRSEMRDIKRAPLTEKESQTMEVLARKLSNSVLKEMRVV